MFHLDGLWLLSALAVVYIVGVTTSTWLKDKIKGVPAELRTALSNEEASALARIGVAKVAAVKAVAVAPAAPAAPAASGATGA